MRPRTIASALASPATRSPRRPSSASRTACVTSCVREGSGVSFVNGTIATVLTFGSRPPLNPYGHPASQRPDALTAATPQSRRNDRRGIHAHHGELKPGRSLREIDARPRGARLRIERGTAPRDHRAASPPLGLEHPLDAVRRDVVQRIALV